MAIKTSETGRNITIKEDGSGPRLSSKKIYKNMAVKDIKTE